jgi:hypothetical protein
LEWTGIGILTAIAGRGWVNEPLINALRLIFFSHRTNCLFKVCLLMVGRQKSRGHPMLDHEITTPVTLVWRNRGLIGGTYKSRQL